jgi:hypothetical protein
MAMIDDIATHLQTQGVGTIGTDLFKSYLPDITGTAVAVLDTGGLEPDTYLPTHEPTFQVFVRSDTYSVGKAKLAAIRSALHQQKNLTVGSTYFYFILANSEGGHLGLNERGQNEFSMNFHCRTR